MNKAKTDPEAPHIKPQDKSLHIQNKKKTTTVIQLFLKKTAPNPKVTLLLNQQILVNLKAGKRKKARLIPEKKSPKTTINKPPPQNQYYSKIHVLSRGTWVGVVSS